VAYEQVLQCSGHMSTLPQAQEDDHERLRQVVC
jgi:hypothetical protein